MGLFMSQTDAYTRFLASKSIGYEQWHDGIGYDMKAFAAMAPAEQDHEVRIALEKNDPDWRDLDVIAAKNDRACVDHLRDLLLHPSVETRGHALSRLIDGGHTPGSVPDVQLAHIIDALPDDDDEYPAMTQALYLAHAHGGPISKLALLRGAKEKRVLALNLSAALLDMKFDCPDTAAFDKRFRPLLLRMLPGNAENDREAAFREVCERLEIDANAIPERGDPHEFAWAEKTWPRTD